VGRHLQPFQLYKLRTMRLDTAHVASHLAPSSQITRVGRLLRRLKIDELPQLICVLRGDMSLVGPRPCLPAQTELVEERSRRGVYKARPGITGLAQVNGIDMSTPVELAIADAEYVHNMHLALDLRLLARTVIGHGMGDAIRP
jgi:lipopolysaccharide/colanic/teichoic acid biosynthesis glycosyltransferase